MYGYRLVSRCGSERVEMTVRDGASVDSTRGRAPWTPPTLKPVGTIRQVVQGGGGKLSVTGGDTGEPRKQVGSSG
jgi:hypothetical protein